MKRSTIAIAIVGLMSILIAEAATKPDQAKNTGHVAKENYVPEMGEIMGATQMRHSKLWFAGSAKNWELASYELDEIKEGLDDAVKYYPTFKNNAPVSAMLDKFTSQPLTDLGSATKAKDEISFKRSFDRLTNACNSCHRAAGMGFIVIKRPGVSPFSNQEFAIKAR